MNGLVLHHCIAFTKQSAGLLVVFSQLFTPKFRKDNLPNPKIASTMDPSSQPLYSLHMQRLMVSDTLQDSEVNSEEPDMFNFLFHDVFVFGTQEIAPGVSIARKAWAQLCIEFVRSGEDARPLLKSLLVEKVQPQFLSLLENEIIAWLLRSVLDKDFDPWSYYCRLQKSPSEILLPGQPLLDYQEEERIMEDLRRRIAQEGAEAVLNFELEQAKVVPNNEACLPDAVKSHVLFRSQLAMVRVHRALNPGADIRNVLESLTQAVCTSGKTVYVHVSGIPFNFDRCKIALRKGRIEAAAFKLFEKILDYRYFKSNVKFESFSKVCEVAKLAIYQLSKSLMMEIGPNTYTGKTQLRSDFTGFACRKHLPTKEEILSIDKYITWHALQKQVKNYEIRPTETVPVPQKKAFCMFDGLLGNLEDEVLNSPLFAAVSMDMDLDFNELLGLDENQQPLVNDVLGLQQQIPGPSTSSAEDEVLLNEFGTASEKCVKHLLTELHKVMITTDADKRKTPEEWKNNVDDNRVAAIIERALVITGEKMRRALNSAFRQMVPPNAEVENRIESFISYMRPIFRDAFERILEKLVSEKSYDYRKRMKKTQGHSG